MRLFLLPISTRRTLIYCQRLTVTPTNQLSYLDRSTAKAANLWAGWEKSESGWRKKIVEYGNQALKRIPYEEWGLKSIPPLSSHRKQEALSGKQMVEVLFPSSLIPEESVFGVLRKLGTERQGLHRNRMLWSIVGMPIVAPFAAVPVIPNIPFFYLVFRAWSHWRAWYGSKHIEFLLDKQLIRPQPSQILDEIYATGNNPFVQASVSAGGSPSPNPNEDETMVLNKANSKVIADALRLPEIEVELDRAVWQVEQALKAKDELRDEKTELDSAKKTPREEK
ncbi:hypothetical protein B7494_g583 [Chlorociboria aeruginascens]|nr:hypothetical protein B7494_g583 [Chlorociboria aeruginascens]